MATFAETLEACQRQLDLMEVKRNDFDARCSKKEFEITLGRRPNDPGMPWLS